MPDKPKRTLTEADRQSARYTMLTTGRVADMVGTIAREGK